MRIYENSILFALRRIVWPQELKQNKIKPVQKSPISAKIANGSWKSIGICWFTSKVYKRIICTFFSSHSNSVLINVSAGNFLPTRKFPEISYPIFPEYFRKFPTQYFQKISGNILGIFTNFGKYPIFFRKIFKTFFGFCENYSKTTFGTVVGWKAIIRFQISSTSCIKIREFQIFPGKIENFRKFPPLRKFPEILHRETFPEISYPLENFRKFYPCAFLWLSGERNPG